MAVMHVTGRAKLSGVNAELRYAVVHSFRGDKIVCGREYADRAQALAAVQRSD